MKPRKINPTLHWILNIGPNSADLFEFYQSLLFWFDCPGVNMEFPDTDVGLLNFVKFLSMARDEANTSSVVLEPIVQVRF